MEKISEDDLKIQLFETAKLRDLAWDEYDSIDLSDRGASKAAFDRYIEYSNRYRELREEQWRQHREYLMGELYRLIGFRRPETGFLGLLSRPLGPLPRHALVIQPSKKSLAELPSYRLPAFLLVLGAIALLVGLAVAAPWLVVSPLSLLIGFYSGMFGPIAAHAMAVITVVCLISIVSRWKNPPLYYEGSFIDRAAMQEEQWFRMGAESWTSRQRIISSVLFGTVHITNMFYPVTSVLVLMLVGVVFMAAYMREYRRSGDTERATLASTKLHATYNRFAILYMIAALTLLIVVNVAF